MNLLLDCTDTGMISVALRADGWVTVFHFQRGKNEWKRLGSKAMGALDKTKDHAFELSVASGKIQARLGGKVVLTCGTDGRDMKGPWVDRQNKGCSRRFWPCDSILNIAPRPESHAFSALLNRSHSFS